jgi:hypothetical protein
VDALERLQAFFNAASSQRHAYVSTNTVEELYVAVAELSRLGYGYVNYVASNLSLGASLQDHSELHAAILSHVRERRVVASTFVADCALRAALELMPHSTAELPPAIDDALRRALVPLARIHDSAQLAKRHQPSPRL